MKADRASVLDKEQGAIVKKWKGRLPVALVFPNVYRLAMSNLGMQIVSRLDPRLVDPGSVHEGAVGAPQVDDADLSVG